MGNPRYVLVASLAMLFVCSSLTVQATTYVLSGSQKAGSISGGPKIGGKALTLKKPAVITKVNRQAESFTLWKDGKAFVSGDKNHEVTGLLPAGRYILKTSAGKVSIHLNDGIKPPAITLWAKQKKGPNHWFKGNRVVLGQAYSITNFRYNGTKGVGIFSVVNNQSTHRPTYQHISAHNKREKGPRQVDAKGKQLKTLKGKILGPGVFTCTPGLGTADQIVEASFQLKAK